MRFVVVASVCIFLFFSCKSVGPNEKYTVEDILRDNISLSDNLSIPSDNSSVICDNRTIDPSENITGNWINPGKVFVEGLFPGGRAEYFIKIHNGKSKDSYYSVICRSAGHFEEVYNKDIPLFWMIITNPKPYVLAGETVEIPIYLEMPLSYKMKYREKMEMVVGVMDLGREGNVKIELCSKWLVTTK